MKLKKPNAAAKQPSVSAGGKTFIKTRFSSRGLISFILVFGVIGAVFLINSFATPTPPTVYMTSPSAFLPVNTSFSVQVRENSGTTAVNAVGAYISYPSNLLDLTSVDTSGSAFALSVVVCPGSKCTGTPGQIQLEMSIGNCTETGCDPPVTGDQLVATLNFKTKSTGGMATAAFTDGTKLLADSTSTNILSGLGATGGFTTTIDTSPPSVSVSAPSNGATVSCGSTATVSASASDNDQVTSVDIYIDGAKVTTLTGSPYNYSWKTSCSALGSHTIQAKATDPSGNVGSSSTISVTVADETPPSVSFTAPSNNATLSGSNVTLSATASDNVAIAGVGFSISKDTHGSVIATVYKAPYTTVWDSYSVSDGTGYTITATATDTNGNTTSTSVTVSVDNTAPSTPANFHMTGNTLTSISLAWSASSDNTGVKNYRLKRNGSTIATLSGSTLTYTDNNLTSTTTYDYSLVAIDSVGNVSSAATLSAATVTGKTGDITGDNKVDLTDLSILLHYYGTTNSGSDLNKDGIVDLTDLSILLHYYGT